MPGQVQLWVGVLETGSATDAVGLLSEDELVRANSFQFDVHRQRFIHCRAQLRRLLASHLQTDPRDVRFCYGQHGKPALAGDATRLRFNVTRSADVAAIAVTLDHDIGIDVEQLRLIDNLESLTGRVLSPIENKALAATPAELRAAQFLRFWTRKEARLKATGTGLGAEPEIPDIELELHDFEPAQGFVGAYAVCVQSSPSERPG